MHKLQIFSFAAIAVMFAGCASIPKPQAYDAAHSKAWNLARAAGLKNVKDFVWEDHTDRNVVGLGAVYAGASMLPGLSFDPVSIVFGLLSSAASSGRRPIESLNDIFVWMPANMAKTPKEARMKVLREMEKVVDKTMPKFVDGQTKQIEILDTYNFHYAAINFTPNVKIKGHAFSVRGIIVQMPMLRSAPEWMGGGKIWAFDAEDSAGFNFSQKSREINLYSQKVSALLPGYFYIYLAPTDKHGPAIFNQGHVYLFAKPKAVASK